MLGVYIHIPFCHKICSYCDFCKMYYNKKYIDKYLDSLEKEINTRYQGELVDSIYIGGGTPSCLALDELERLFNILKIFKIKDKYEYTIECNPENLNEDKLKLFRECGINRLSIGIESFNKDILKILNRYDNHDIYDKIALSKEYFKNINIDLIYGINNNIDILKEDINNFLKLDIPHISCYSLIIEEHTKIYLDNKKYISEDIDYEMYKYIRDTLINNNYKHYEISNYAKDDYESIHNKNYWLNGEYYGFGLSAVSYLNNYRISNTKNMSKYLNNYYLYSKIYEDINVRRENALMLGTRLINGLNIVQYNKKYCDNLLDRNIIKELIKDGYLEIYMDNIRINNNYVYLQNMILERIIGELND